MSRNNCTKRTDYFAFNYQSLTGEKILFSHSNYSFFVKPLQKVLYGRELMFIFAPKIFMLYRIQAYDEKG